MNNDKIDLGKSIKHKIHKKLRKEDLHDGMKHKLIEILVVDTLFLPLRRRLCADLKDIIHNNVLQIILRRIYHESRQ